MDRWIGGCVAFLGVCPWSVDWVVLCIDVMDNPPATTNNNDSRSTSWASTWVAWCRRKKAGSTWRPSTGRTGAYWRWLMSAHRWDLCLYVCVLILICACIQHTYTHGRRFEDGAGEMWGVDSAECTYGFLHLMMVIATLLSTHTSDPDPPHTVRTNPQQNHRRQRGPHDQSFPRDLR